MVVRKGDGVGVGPTHEHAVSATKSRSRRSGPQNMKDGRMEGTGALGIETSSYTHKYIHKHVANILNETLEIINDWNGMVEKLARLQRQQFDDAATISGEAVRPCN